MSIDLKEYYPNGSEYEHQDLGWGRCPNCKSGLHNLGVEYDPEYMQSWEAIVCPNCQERMGMLNVKWHSPDGLVFDNNDDVAYIAHMESIGADLPLSLQEDLAWAARVNTDDDDLDDDYQHFTEAWLSEGES